MRLPDEQAGPGGGMLSPTFREERLLGKREENTEKEQAKDLVSDASQYTKAYNLLTANF